MVKGREMSDGKPAPGPTPEQVAIAAKASMGAMDQHRTKNGGVHDPYENQ